jgi:hypothetical protein
MLPSQFSFGNCFTKVQRIGRRSLKLQVENPSAICCLNNRLKPGKYVTVKTRAITEDGHPPSRCHIKLGVVDLDPSDIKSHDPEFCSK